MLQKSAAQGEEIHNPAVKLIEYLEKSYGVIEGFEGKKYNFRDYGSAKGQRSSLEVRAEDDRCWSCEDGLGFLVAAMELRPVLGMLMHEAVTQVSYHCGKSTWRIRGRLGVQSSRQNRPMSLEYGKLGPKNFRHLAKRLDLSLPRPNQHIMALVKHDDKDPWPLTLQRVEDGEVY